MSEPINALELICIQWTVSTKKNVMLILHNVGNAVFLFASQCTLCLQTKCKIIFLAKFFLVRIESEWKSVQPSNSINISIIFVIKLGIILSNRNFRTLHWSIKVQEICSVKFHISFIDFVNAIYTTYHTCFVIFIILIFIWFHVR